MYPNQGQPGYPQQPFGNSMPTPGIPTTGYPAPQPGYPNPQGFSQVSQGYPSQTGTQGYPQAQTAYPQSQPGYPQSQPGYPQSQPGYPQAQPGYPQAQPGYPQSQSGYPQAQPGYPQSQPGYAQAQPPYPQTQPPYPQAQTGYPQAQTGYPQAQPGYPQAQTGYPQAQTGYPPASQAYVASYAQPNQNQPQQNNKPKSKPTVTPVQPFDPRKDAEILRKAMKGLGTDEKAIIQVLARRSNEQRIRIAYEFKTLYGKDLIADLKSETSGKFEDLLLAMMTPLPKYYAKELHDAISGIGTDEGVLIEVMCTMSNHEINAIKQAYTAIYGTLLEDDLRGDTSGNFKRLMTSLCVGNRSEETHIDQDRAREDARSLLQAGELRLGTDESVFNMVLCSRSFPQLAAIFNEYQYLTGHDIDDAIKSEFSGDIEKALRTIVKVVRSKPLYFAERLHKSMKGLGTNDRQLIRIMVTRSEIDLGDIADAFQSKYNESLQSWIEGDCSGHYKKCLLALMGLYK